MSIRFSAGCLVEAHPEGKQISCLPFAFSCYFQGVRPLNQTQKGRLMTLKTTFVFLALTLSPSLAFAVCQGEQHAQTISCEGGKVFDTATKACVPVTG